MKSIQQYNGLNGAYTSRQDVKEIIKTAKKEEQKHIADKLLNLLRSYPKAKEFEIDLSEKQEEILPESLLPGIDFMAIPEEGDNPGMGKAVSPDEIYQYITDLMLSTIKEVGHLPWQKEWKESSLANGSEAMNWKTKKKYRGINYFLLNFEEKIINGERVMLPRKFKNPFFLTFNQIKEAGGKLEKGSKGVRVVYFTRLYKYEQAEPQLKFSTYSFPKMVNWLKKNKSQIRLLNSFAPESIASQSAIPILKYYNVFSAEDVTGVEWEIPEPRELTETEKINISDAIISKMPQAPQINHGGGRAFYVPSADYIQMPNRTDFKKIQSYYTTLFHEMVHSTGHHTRLDRELKGSKKSKAYAFEELIAEMGAVFLCAESGILFETRENSAKYLRGWNGRLVKKMKEDNRFFFRASSKSQAAADYILDRNKEGVPAYQIELEKKRKQKPEKKEEKQKKKNNDIDKSTLNQYSKVHFVLNDLPKKYEKRIFNSSLAELRKDAIQEEDKILQFAAMNMLWLLDKKLFVLLNFKHGYGRNSKKQQHRNVPVVYRKLLKKGLQKIDNEKALKFILEKLKEYHYETAWEEYSFNGKNAIEINKIVKFNIRSIERFLEKNTEPKKEEKPKNSLKSESKPKEKINDNGQMALFGASDFSSLKEFAKYAYEWAKKHLTGKTYFHDEIKETVHFKNSGIYHAIRSKRNQLKIQLIFKAMEMLKNSTFIKFEEDKKGRKEIAGVYRMKSFTVIEKVPYEVILTLRKGENGTVYYDHKATKIKKLTLDAESDCKNSTQSAVKRKPLNKDNEKKNESLNAPPENSEKKIEVEPLPVNLNDCENENLPRPAEKEVQPVESKSTSLASRLQQNQNRDFETYKISDPEISKFLGNVEIKEKDSIGISITAPQGAGKTRFAFQLVNAFAENYKVGIASMEEHPESNLFLSKVPEYISKTNLHNVDAPEIESMQDLHKLIMANDVIMIDSFEKLREIDKNVQVDKDLRKKYNGKLFIIIFQLTSDGKMRGGSKSQFDVDIVLETEKFDDYKENYVYANKNRYNNIPANELKFSIYYRKMLSSAQEEKNNSEENPVSNKPKIVATPIEW
ncbi:zincin-like metallopeptidase domain-containing protein [Mesonia aquimarina]|uniref:zincin-like metallopeptidase domain-containing protein n=1 Tax=Mesonia aquimarina TaxID=1504967 RepID=UPI000EF606CB|nr:zincin-like metallopeptidase domain-containing protein [Mesonia aquimarina]